MTGEQFSKLLSGIDERKLSEAENYTESRKFRGKRAVIALAAAALALLIAGGTVFTAFRVGASYDLLQNAEVGPARAAAPITDFPAVPDASGDPISPMRAGFYIGAIFEGKIEEICDSRYLWKNAPCTVLRVKVLDVLYGKGLPETLNVCCDRCPPDAFEGYDRFIFSLRQIGIENFALIEEGTGEIRYFDGMFEPFGAIGSQVASVFAFKNGIFDPTFFEKAAIERNVFTANDWKSYWEFVMDHEDAYSVFLPVGRDTTIENAKARIKEHLESADGVPTEPVVLTKNDFFDGKADLWTEVAPENGVFTHDLLSYGDGTSRVAYERRVNGFPSCEKIYIDSSGTVTKSETHYTEEDLAHVPDIAPLIERFDGRTASSPSAKAVEGHAELVSWRADGRYFKIDGKVSAVILYMWYYRFGDPSNRWCEVGLDRLYVYYDVDGRAETITAEELENRTGVYMMPAGGFTALLSPTDDFGPINEPATPAPTPDDDPDTVKETEEIEETTAPGL
ncbi:MAG: hypothetical protein IJU52_04175 [Clostridia bacterium]|nr:hypothetical protein [Clostridia bacterium]